MYINILNSILKYITNKSEFIKFEFYKLFRYYQFIHTNLHMSKRNIVAIAAKYRIHSNVVKILAQMLGVAPRLNQIMTNIPTYPLIIEDLNGNKFARFELELVIISYSHLRRLIGLISSKFPKNYGGYVLRYINRSTNTSEFVTVKSMAIKDNEQKTCTVYYNKSDNYIDLSIVDTIIVVFTDYMNHDFKTLDPYICRDIDNGYIMKYEDWVYSIKPYLEDVNLMIIAQIFGNNISDIVRDVVEDPNPDRKIDRNTQKILGQLYIHYPKHAYLDRIDKTVVVNGKPLYDIIQSSLNSCIRKYHLPSDHRIELCSHNKLCYYRLKYMQNIKFINEKYPEIQPVRYPFYI